MDAIPGETGRAGRTRNTRTERMKQRTLMREARPGDLERLREISGLTWEGEDYLGSVAVEWMSEEGLYVSETGGVVSGSVKVSTHPDGVRWLEGLRVHPDFRGQGIAGLLTGFSLDLARSAIERGEARSIEFATYYRNEASIHLGSINGFRIVERFYFLLHDGIGQAELPHRLDSPLTLEMMSGYSGYLPHGWELCHRCEEGIEWLEQRGCRLFSTSRSRSASRFYGRGDPGSGSGGFSILLPERRDEMVGALCAAGFRFPEEPGEPCLLVFRLDPS